VVLPLLLDKVMLEVAVTLETPVVFQVAVEVELLLPVVTQAQIQVEMAGLV
jgi:hypothetical protein